jgi:hypothetical protein
VELGLDGALNGFAIRADENIIIRSASFVITSDQPSTAGAGSPCMYLLRAVPAPPQAFGFDGSLPQGPRASWGRTMQLASSTPASGHAVIAGGEIVSEQVSLPSPGAATVSGGSRELDDRTPLQAGGIALVVVGVYGVAALGADTQQESFVRIEADKPFEVRKAWTRTIYCGGVGSEG